MKLKYLLRGIGIGAILATAIIYLVYGKSDKSLSDDEIRARARELGMFTVSEFQEKELNSLKDKLPELSEIKVDEKTEETEVKDKTSVTSSTSKNTPSKEGGEAGLSTDEGDNTGKTTNSEGEKAGVSQDGNTSKKSAEAENAENGNTEVSKTEATGSGNGKTKDGQAKTGNSEKTKISSNSQPKVEVPKKPEPKISSEKIKFSVASGMSSENVAASLKTLGLIDNSVEFNKYLVDNGYAARIKIGTFELQQGQSYAEIAAKLTK